MQLGLKIDIPLQIAPGAAVFARCAHSTSLFSRDLCSLSRIILINTCFIVEVVVSPTKGAVGRNIGWQRLLFLSRCRLGSCTSFLSHLYSCRGTERRVVCASLDYERTPLQQRPNAALFMSSTWIKFHSRGGICRVFDILSSLQQYSQWCWRN